MFSVVIATYNYGRFVARAIDSVLAQTCPDHEIIVVDDGSTDDTPERLRPYADRIRSLRKDNAGQASAYNDGIALARGRYICILDADDELLPDAFERFSAAIRAHGEAEPAVFYGGYVSVAQDGSVRARAAVAAPADAETRLRRFLLGRLSGLQHRSSIVPRVLFERFRYPDGLRNNTDIVLLGQIVANHPAVAVGGLVCRIHDHPGRVRNQASGAVDRPAPGRPAVRSATDAGRPDAPGTAVSRGASAFHCGGALQAATLRREQAVVPAGHALPAGQRAGHSHAQAVVDQRVA